MKTIEIGGNSIKLWLGKKWTAIGERFLKRGERLMAAGNPRVVSNPSCKFINPFTLVISFTVNNTDKFQLVHQGKFQEKWKVNQGEDGEQLDNPIKEKEMFELIKLYQNKWFLKTAS